MNSFYMIENLYKMAEKDEYGNGCDPDSAIHSTVNVKFIGETVAQVIDQALAFLGVDRDSLDVDSFNDEDPDRFDISVLENRHGYAANNNEIAQWRYNRCELWSCIYTGSVEFITSDRVNVKKLLEQ